MVHEASTLLTKSAHTSSQKDPHSGGWAKDAKRQLFRGYIAGGCTIRKHNRLQGGASGPDWALPNCRAIHGLTLGSYDAGQVSEASRN